MADWRPFNPSNEPHTCLWCGFKLRFLTNHLNERYANSGGYRDNSFCGLRCGYMFGLQMVKFGHRIEPRKKEKV